MSLNVHVSPNFGPRRDGLWPTHVVLHYTAMTHAEDALRILCTPEREVSAHYLICKTGKLWQMVPETQRAWHAGAGQWHGLDDMNSRSIGIELDNDGQSPFPAAQMTVLETLLGGILTRWKIPPSHVIGHSDMAPGRKIDPGPFFDWQRLEVLGLAGRRGQDDGPGDPDPVLFRKVAKSAGYSAQVDDETLLAAVRLRYRSGVLGPLCPEDFSPIGHSALWT